MMAIGFCFLLDKILSLKKNNVQSFLFSSSFLSIILIEKFRILHTIRVLLLVHIRKRLACVCVCKNILQIKNIMRRNLFFILLLLLTFEIHWNEMTMMMMSMFTCGMQQQQQQQNFTIPKKNVNIDKQTKKKATNVNKMCE